MNKIFKYLIFAAAASFMLLSCDKFLDSQSPSAADDATVYSNYTYAEQTIFAIHQKFSEQNSYRGRFLPWYGFNTDIEWYIAAKPSDSKLGIVAYDTQTNDSQLNNSKNPYSDMYSAIEIANLTIAGLEEYGNIDKDADMAYLMAEAKTLRAMLYYDLTKAWGDVPARFEPINSATLYMPKASRDVIYKQILSDLEESIPQSAMAR
ncbi:MAG: RagB/SusD family nutrient uptake outer membrane protein [Candidatus Cryptobacteroides sp.]